MNPIDEIRPLSKTLAQFIEKGLLPREIASILNRLPEEDHLNAFVRWRMESRRTAQGVYDHISDSPEGTSRVRIGDFEFDSDRWIRIHRAFDPFKEPLTQYLENLTKDLFTFWRIMSCPVCGWDTDVQEVHTFCSKIADLRFSISFYAAMESYGLATEEHRKLMKKAIEDLQPLERKVAGAEERKQNKRLKLLGVKPSPKPSEVKGDFPPPSATN